MNNMLLILLLLGGFNGKCGCEKKMPCDCPKRKKDYCPCSVEPTPCARAQRVESRSCELQMDES